MCATVSRKLTSAASQRRRPRADLLAPHALNLPEFGSRPPQAGEAALIPGHRAWRFDRLAPREHPDPLAHRLRHRLPRLGDGGSRFSDGRSPWAERRSASRSKTPNRPRKPSGQPRPLQRLLGCRPGVELLRREFRYRVHAQSVLSRLPLWRGSTAGSPKMSILFMQGLPATIALALLLFARA